MGHSAAFRRLLDFLKTKMRMSHIYQPVMIRTLMEGGGTATVETIAKALLSEDRSQIDYYRLIVNNMVGRVLRNRRIVKKEGDRYALNGYGSLSAAERKQLWSTCTERVNQFLAMRGDQIWDHRRKSVGYISGSLRYEVLKAAKFRCELCGTSAEVRALEVDHILPRNKGGTDDRSNLQALCYRCNSMKRDTDDTDFRMVRRSYDHREEGCIFCKNSDRSRRFENALALGFEDAYPVTHLHSLVVPKRHVASIFDLGSAELNACWQLIGEIRGWVVREDPGVKGFNIGVNEGLAAGQTVTHVHVHVIPRRHGDVEDPVGGVRRVFADKANYLLSPV